MENGKEKAFFSNVFLGIGSVLLGIGAVVAGLMKLWSGQTFAGVAYIAGSAALIALCAVTVIHGNRSAKK